MGLRDLFRRNEADTNITNSVTDYSSLYAFACRRAQPQPQVG